jgi:hypothetical protein
LYLKGQAMKIRVSFKTPDVVENAIYGDLIQTFDEHNEETLHILKERAQEILNQLTKWVRYGESITIEFDTEAGTATVLENKR